MSRQQNKVCAIINPVSGVGSKRKIPKMIEEAFPKKAYDLDILFTEYAGHAGELAVCALDREADRILAVGGDGTINEVAKSMMHSEAVLGIIPQGSGNGLARELHIPMDVKRALEVIVKGKVSTIDSCTANDRVFFCTCGVGFDAAVSQKFAHEKHRGSLTYIKNTIEEYLSYKPQEYRLLTGDKVHEEKAFLVACSNASQYGNNAFIAPHADIQDGLMDITILSPFSPPDIFTLAVQLFTKRLDKNSKIKTLKASSVTILRQTPGVMHLDGEPVMAESEIQLSVIPRSLKVYTPAEVSFTEEVYHLFGQVTRFFDEKLPYIFK
ncbi:Diacylglycerol kinase [Bacteroidales bacterium Barb6XT]|nr:Diacylglycerol kinase [Bacteroidales bacterium Barb6XT]